MKQNLTKYFIGSVALLLALSACSKDETSIPSYVTSPTVTELTETSINGTTIDSTSTVAGLITNTSTGVGIAGVPVTDGYNFVVTDANGVYQMARDSRARKVYYSIPAAYEVPLDPDNHYPAFFSGGIMESDKSYRVDFELTPLESDETEFTLIAIGDPQCQYISEYARYKSETIADIKETMSSGTYKNIYAITLGDITFDGNEMYPFMVNSMANCEINGRYLPYFQCVGNHDHDATVGDGSDALTNDYNALLKYVTNFGPTDYSFDRGQAHIVVMDNVPVTSVSTNSSPNGATWSYDSYLTDEQLAWLKQDLGLVKGKESKLIFFVTHQPFRSAATTTDSYKTVMSLLSEFKEAHLMIGHTHYVQNYIHTTKTVGGTYVYEHVHGAACGAWWYANSNVTGAPNGYSIYEINGANVTNWVAKGTGQDESYQMRVYDGNQIYTGSKSYEICWYENWSYSSSVTSKGTSKAADALVVEVFNDDDTYWTLDFYKNGSLVASYEDNTTNRSNSGVSNQAIVAYWFNEKSKSSSTWTSTTASHYWYIPFEDIGISSAEDLEDMDWEVRAKQTIPTSGNTNVYSCSTLTTDYSEF